MPINVAYIGGPQWIGGPHGPVPAHHRRTGGQRVVAEVDDTRTIASHNIENALDHISQHVSIPLLNCYRNAFEHASALKPDEAHRVVGDVVPLYSVQDGIPIFTIKYTLVFRSQTLLDYANIRVCFDVAVSFLEQAITGINQNVQVMQTQLNDEPRIGHVSSSGTYYETFLHASITTGLDKSCMGDM